MKTQVTLLLLLAFNLSISQSINTEVQKEGKQPYLLGKINKKGLESSIYNTWFTKGFSSYQPKDDIISKIRKPLKEYKILVFLGTWCGDSKREVPRFYKILEKCNYPMERLTVIAVSNEPGMYKQSPDHEERDLNIFKVPTFIYYKNGVEVNRIVESPISSLEEDMYKLIFEKYTPNYSSTSKNIKTKPK